jgi:hypothetical protein
LAVKSHFLTEGFVPPPVLVEPRFVKRDDLVV